MIIIAGTSTVPRTNRYIHHRDTVLATTSLSVVDGTCCFCSCDTIIPAFVDLTDTGNKDKNDWFSWLLKVPSNSTVVATLTDLDTNTAHIINNDTYGNYYATGDLKTNVWGLTLDWWKIVTAFGYGNYQMNVTVTNLATTVIFNNDYPAFVVMPYSCDSVHGTVRIEMYNTGYIEGGFDYRNFDFGGPPNAHQYGVSAGWGQQIRWYGKFTISNYTTQIDNLSDNYRNLLQVQTQIENEYNLRLDFIKMDIGNQIIYDNFLSDYLLISDYNANNIDDYKNIKVSLVNIESPQQFGNRTVLLNIKFVPYKQNRLKRFY